jgi:hypothetical protein
MMVGHVSIVSLCLSRVAGGGGIAAYLAFTGLRASEDLKRSSGVLTWVFAHDHEFDGPTLELPVQNRT